MDKERYEKIKDLGGKHYSKLDPNDLADFAVLVQNEIPIDMILHCPKCGCLHLDEPEPDMCRCGHEKSVHHDDEDAWCGYWDEGCSCRGFTIAWDNPPHKSHLCHGCGTIWRPADVPTNGVAKIQTRGGKDTWPN